MCKVGDIILVKKYKDGKHLLEKHSFVVINDENGKIKGLSYDMICNVLSSYKSETQMKQKLSYPGNFPIANEDTDTNPDNGKSGYLKTDQLYYFNKEKIDYTVIGNIKPDILNLVFEYIENSDFELTAVIDNL